MLNKLSKIVVGKSKVVGRGIGSGKGGHTTGKGTKGHKSRAGYKSPRPGFEGGQMPISRRLPKLRGISKKAYAKNYHVLRNLDATVTFDMLNKLADGDNVTLESLKENKIIAKRYRSAKVVLRGKLDKKLNIEGLKLSEKAKSEIEKIGGSVK